MKVTSKESIHFPSLNWGINAGEIKELPADKEAQAVILSHPSISKPSEKEKAIEQINKN